MNMIEMEFIKESNITSFIYCIFWGMYMYGTSRTIYQNECGENSYPMMLKCEQKMYKMAI